MPVTRETQYQNAGIAKGYRDAFGNWRQTPDATRAAILKELDTPKTVIRGKSPKDGPGDSAYLPPVIAAGGGVWGFAIQLYGLRSTRNWGIGDFTDLVEFVDCVAGLGADVVSVNPLHALFPGNPAHISPYAPSSRIFRNFLYLDVEAIPDFSTCRGARRKVGNAEFQKGLQGLRAKTLVDHVGVAAHKRPVLEILFEHFCTDHLTGEGGAKTERGRAFREYQTVSDDALAYYGIFEAIAEHVGSQNGADYRWRQWPVELRTPTSAGVLPFATKYKSRVEFHQYLQWEIDRQLNAVQARCRNRDMAVGLLHDLAVGFDASGADSWTLQHMLCSGLSIGAPPDQLSPNGQDWGFPPFNPFVLETENFSPVVQTLRANLAHGGGLRIDHVLGFARQYWVPHGMKATDGAYVSFPMESLLSVTIEENRRAACLVVGEDLGTVPDGFRERLAQAQLLSYRLAYFERDDAGELPPPQAFPPLALVAAGTHDLPTLSGFWCGRDIDLRKKLGFFATYDIEDDLRVARDRDRQVIWQGLISAGLLADVSPGNPPPVAASPALASALYTYLAGSQSCLLMIHPEDLLGVEEQINLPGVVDGHPNWQRKMAVTIDGFRTDARITEACERVDAIRRATRT